STRPGSRARGPRAPTTRSRAGGRGRGRRGSALLQVREAELLQHLGRLRELDLRVLDDLNEVPPRVSEVVPAPEELHAGLAQSRQNWHLVVVGDGELRKGVAAVVYGPQDILGAALVGAVAVAGTGPSSFDAGRGAQNMLLAAWNEVVGGWPNGIKVAAET